MKLYSPTELRQILTSPSNESEKSLQTQFLELQTQHLYQTKTGYYPFIELGGVVVHPDFRGQGLFSKISKLGLEWIKTMVTQNFEFPFPTEVTVTNVPIAIVAHGQFHENEVLKIRDKLIETGEFKLNEVNLGQREVGKAQAVSTASEYLAKKLGFQYVGASITGLHLGGVYVKNVFVEN